MACCLDRNDWNGHVCVRQYRCVLCPRAWHDVPWLFTQSMWGFAQVWWPVPETKVTPRCTSG